MLGRGAFRLKPAISGKDAGNIRSGLPPVKSHGLLWRKTFINGAGVGLRTHQGLHLTWKKQKAQNYIYKK